MCACVCAVYMCLCVCACVRVCVCLCVRMSEKAMVCMFACLGKVVRVHRTKQMREEIQMCTDAFSGQA